MTLYCATNPLDPCCIRPTPATPFGKCVGALCDGVRPSTSHPGGPYDLSVAKTSDGYVNAFGLTEFDGRCTFFQAGSYALPQGLGWFIICGLGGVFAIFTTVLVYMGDRYSGHEITSEEYSTAGRSIKTGLTAADIVSKWTWAATLLQSANVAYKFGISGPFWYAAGATIQVLLFAVLAVEVKRKCPSVHTILEIVDARWGNPAHLVFLVFAFITNIIVTSMLILGGAATIEALSGVDVYAAAFIIPFGVVLYTAHGGLKATFIASWAHVGIIMIAMCIFMFEIYGTDPMLGSPKRVWENLRVMRIVMPVKGNRVGSYLTMWSESGLIFGIINIIGNFGTVFVDQSYWQSAIAAKPSATYKGYMLGGVCWFSIPFTLATSLGLAARAFDLPVTVNESNSGLVPAAVALHVLGRGGAFLLVLQLFMAVIATASAEQIAVSSLYAYDIYRRYINPKATGQQIVLLSRVGIVCFGIISGLLAIALLQLGLSLGWVYLAMGIFIGAAVFPLAFALVWARCSGIAAISGTVFATLAGIAAWLIQCKVQFPDSPITKDLLGEDYPMLAGCCASLFGSIFITVPLAFIFPQNYDWAEMYKKTESNQIEYDGTAELNTSGEDSMEAMDTALYWTYRAGGALSLVLIIIWPALTLPVGDFTESYWGWWVALALAWALAATFACIFLPIWEERDIIVAVFKSVVLRHPIPAKVPAAHRKVARDDPHKAAEEGTPDAAPAEAEGPASV